MIVYVFADVIFYSDRTKMFFFLGINVAKNHQDPFGPVSSSLL